MRTTVNLDAQLLAQAKKAAADSGRTVSEVIEDALRAALALHLAALVIEAGGEWITTDRDYARFPGLRWRHPLARP